MTTFTLTFWGAVAVTLGVVATLFVAVVLPMLGLALIERRRKRREAKFVKRIELAADELRFDSEPVQRVNAIVVARKYRGAVN